MFRSLYNKYPFFTNLLVVLVLLEITRTLDWLAWYPPSPENTRILLLEQLFEFLSLFPFALLMIASYKWAAKQNRTQLVVFLVLVFTLLGPALLIYFSSGLETLFWCRPNRPAITLDVLKKYTPGLAVVILFLSTTFYLTRLQIRFARQKEDIHRAEALAREVQLKMLHYQINPHFLFNVLNSIHALIDENTGQAKKLVVEMSEYYRITLNKPEQNIAIGKEVEAVERYLEIQKTRFEDDFEYVITVDEAAKGMLIPSFIIHLLVENAVKYGDRTDGKKLIIDISVRKDEKLLTIRIANTGKLLDSTINAANSPDSSHRSIASIKSRLEMLFAGRFSFSLKQEEGWVVATIELQM